MKDNSGTSGIYIVLVSIHGLLRGGDLELGRDADTGGQTRYVLELARALARQPGVWRVDLLTRQVFDPKVSDDYAEPVEPIADGAFIVRLPCGPRRYLRKEVLWPHLDSFTDMALQHVRRIGCVPEVVHGHYADAGYVSVRLAALLGVPMIFTGHSLGRDKRRRLRDSGMKVAAIESRYNIGARIEAEEQSLDSAAMVVASTRQEVEQQYCQYDNYQPERMQVIPPGVDLERFNSSQPGLARPPVWQHVARFLTHPRKPMILALCRPDERKNLSTLVQAYAQTPGLRELANLVIVAGNRDDIAGLDEGARTVLTGLLMQIDKYDLYGSVALPKHHAPEDVPDLYRLAARQHGVFVNPALVEPFGLTLIEAAACGLPIVATEDGGPQDIVHNCRNGLLIDPMDAKAMGKSLLSALTERSRWKKWSRSGLSGVTRYYSWDGHARSYLAALKKAGGRGRRFNLDTSRSRLPTVDRILVTDLDDTLLGDEAALARFIKVLSGADQGTGFAVATGRSLEDATRVMKQAGLPTPDLLITSVGAEIHYGHRMLRDEGWAAHINNRWDPRAMRTVLRGIPGLKLQPRKEQHPLKQSYFYDAKKAPGVREIIRLLRQHDLKANVIFSRGMFLDFLPKRASKGLALRYLTMRWAFNPDHFLVAGGAGNDEEMLKGTTLGVVVGNYSDELEKLRGKPRIWFAEAEHADGIIQGIKHYNFFGDIRIPQDEVG